MAKNGSDNGKAEFVQDEIIVKFKGDEKPFRVIKVPEGKVEEKVKEYQGKKEVEYAEPNYIAYAQLIPNDLYYIYQWHLDNSVYGGIQMEKAWDISTGQGVTVAVVDTGIRKGTDLANACFVSGYDFVNNDNDPIDDNGHGTHVAGTVAQSTNNGVGVAGVAFGSCLMPVKVLDSRGSGSYTQVVNGIYYAVNNGAKVINLSLGGSSPSLTLEEAVAYAFGKGVTVIAAAGNDNSSTLIYPAAYDAYVIAVGATQYDETKAPYSNYGPSLDLVAPGGNTALDQNVDGYSDGVLQQTFQIRGKTISWGYYFFQGTSMAAPHVSGVSALLIAKGNATTPNEIRAALQETAEDKGVDGRDDIYGYGLVDAYAALGWTAAPVITCSSDTECDDTNECTMDACINPGTISSYCQNTAVADDATCTGGICCGGICSAAVCTENLNCDDTNECTADTCYFGGTCSASCSNTWSGCSLVSDECCGPECTSETDVDCPAADPCLNCFKGVCDGKCNPVKEGVTCPDCW